MFKINVMDDDKKENKSKSEGHRKQNLSVKNQLLKIGIASLVLTTLAVAMLYLGIFKYITNFEARYGLYVIYTIISATVIGIGVWHIRAYRKIFTCSMGMMTGMTIGMMSGFLLGAIIGATNGMFIGSVYGMLMGMFIGAWCTRTCGIMSIMEGLMAGLMGGLMGAMTSIMMYNDNIVLFMPLLVGSIVVIMIGMSIMIQRETEEQRHNISKSNNYDMLNYIALMFLLAMLTLFLMVYGPKSALLAVY